MVFNIFSLEISRHGYINLLHNHDQPVRVWENHDTCVIHLSLNPVINKELFNKCRTVDVGNGRINNYRENVSKNM